MSKADEIMASVTRQLENQGVLIDSENDAKISYIGLGNRKRASLIKPFLSQEEEETIDVEAEATRLVEEAKAQIRAYQEVKE